MQNIYTFTLNILESLKEMHIWLYLIDVFLEFFVFTHIHIMD